LPKTGTPGQLKVNQQKDTLEDVFISLVKQGSEEGEKVE